MAVLLSTALQKDLRFARAWPPAQNSVNSSEASRWGYRRALAANLVGTSTPGTHAAPSAGVSPTCLETEGLATHKDFLHSHCVGHRKEKDYSLGTSDGMAKSPDWASSIRGVEAKAYRDGNSEKNGARSASLLTAAWSLQRVEIMASNCRMAKKCTQAAMLGQNWIASGGGSGSRPQCRCLFVGTNYKRSHHWATFAEREKSNRDLPFPWRELARYAAQLPPQWIIQRWENRLSGYQADLRWPQLRFITDQDLQTDWQKRGVSQIRLLLMSLVTPG